MRHNSNALETLGLQRTALKHQIAEIEKRISELEEDPEYHDSSEWDYAYDGHDEVPIGPFTSPWLEADIFAEKEKLWDIYRQIGEINKAIERLKK